MGVRHRGLVAIGLVALGYLLGSSGVMSHTMLRAQTEEPLDGPSEQTLERMKEAHSALMTAMTALQQEKRYVPVMKGVNAFAVLAGGVDAKADLETGRGVDPETFAALYADQATDEVAAHLDKDEQGRLTYKGKVVRMYSISRLKTLFAERAKLSG